MALIIYVYQFPGKSNRLHLAAELTNIPEVKDNPHLNYISYYAYQDSQSEREEMATVRAAQLHGDAGGSGACYMFQTANSIKGFGVATKAYDKSLLKLQQAIYIRTKQDGASSPIDEVAIAIQWKEARSLELTDGTFYNARTMYKSKHLVTFKTPFRFDVNSRHCGTIIQNILMNEPIAQDHKEATTEKNWLLTSLTRTMQQAQTLALDIAAENKDEFVKYEDLKAEYAAYRSSKIFWQKNSPEMAKIKTTLDTYKHFELIPATGLACASKKMMGSKKDAAAPTEHKPSPST